MAKKIGELTRAGKLLSVAGGGDTVAALDAAGVTDELSYVSTAGGAFLEWLEGRELPGVMALATAARRCHDLGINGLPASIIKCDDYFTRVTGIRARWTTFVATEPEKKAPQGSHSTGAHHDLIGPGRTGDAVDGLGDWADLGPALEFDLGLATGCDGLP